MLIDKILKIREEVLCGWRKGGYELRLVREGERAGWREGERKNWDGKKGDKDGDG